MAIRAEAALCQVIFAAGGAVRAARGTGVSQHCRQAGVVDAALKNAAQNIQVHGASASRPRPTRIIP